MFNEDIDAYLERKEAYLDRFIDEGTDQELFATSYIHGHFSVVAAQTLQGIDSHSVSKSGNSQFDTFKRTFEDALKTSIDSAIDNNELASDDVTDVLSLFNALLELK